MRVFTKEQLQEILAKHLKWVNSEAGGERANLSSANLRYANLSSANLRYANLRYANLSSADLRYANLSSADLSSANLRYANLSSADLSSANLRYANLRYANLSSADLSSANLRYANLSSADLSSADLRYADLVYFTFRRHTAYFVFDGKIRIGCINETPAWWAKNGKKAGIKEGYTKEEIEGYSTFIKLCAKLQKKHKKQSP